MRKIFKRIKIDNESYQEIEKVLKNNGINFDGMLISLSGKMAYLWNEDDQTNNLDPIHA